MCQGSIVTAPQCSPVRVLIHSMYKTEAQEGAGFGFCLVLNMLRDAQYKASHSIFSAAFSSGKAIQLFLVVMRLETWL